MNYIGSKYSLLSFLDETISKVCKFDDTSNLIFADLFAGTGVVGSYFRSKGYKVISNDIQYYSYCLIRHLIVNDYSVDTKLFDYFNGLEPLDGFIYDNYCLGSGSGRNYFTDSNGKNVMQLEAN